MDRVSPGGQRLLDDRHALVVPELAFEPINELWVPSDSLLCYRNNDIWVKDEVLALALLVCVVGDARGVIACLQLRLEHRESALDATVYTIVDIGRFKLEKLLQTAY